MPEVLILTATPGEFAGVKARLERFRPAHFDCRVVETGAGKLNAAMWASRLLALGPPPALVLGAGTAGSLDLELRSGDVLASNETLIADWREEGESGWRTAAYGSFDYGEPEQKADQMAIRCSKPLVLKLLDRLGDGFLRGRLLSSDSFVAGQAHKLRLGRAFGCRICEMESGAVAHVCRRSGDQPWLQIRVVADTLDDSLKDYFRMEKDVVKALSEKVAKALSLLDEGWEGLAG
jgi:nucleoside phosphorylase